MPLASRRGAVVPIELSYLLQSRIYSPCTHQWLQQVAVAEAGGSQAGHVGVDGLVASTVFIWDGILSLWWEKLAPHHGQGNIRATILGAGDSAHAGKAGMHMARGTPYCEHNIDGGGKEEHEHRRLVIS